MLADHDVRMLGPRLGRTVLAIAIGFPVGFGLTLLLPTRDHFPLPPGSCGFGHWDQGHFVEGGNPTLMFIAGVALSLALYALLSLRKASAK